MLKLAPAWSNEKADVKLTLDCFPQRDEFGHVSLLAEFNQHFLITGKRYSRH
jgi:hypothetical protein